MISNFSELSLSEPLQRALAELGFETPSPIQSGALPILLGESTDFIGLAATGTGKTAAYSIPMLEKLDPSAKTVQALIMCPTRELALQVTGQIDLLGKYLGIKALPVYGGTGYGDQLAGLRRGVQIVVGTPGRIVDHIEKGSLKLKDLKTIILDEADEMISMGFKEDMEKIISASDPETRNIWLFSATMDREVRKVADEYLTDPEQVEVNRTEMLSATVEQVYFVTSEGNKQDVLCKLIDAADDFYGIVFCQTKALCADLVQSLRTRGYAADTLHGDLDQNARERTLQAYRDRKVNLLICTDVAARGIDVKDITHVINYSIPRELDNYVHRIGRTARNGKTGYAYSLVTPSHRGLIPRIEKLTKSKMKEGKIPTRREIGERKLLKVLGTFSAVEDSSKAQTLLGDAWKTALAGLEKEEIAARLLSLQYPEIFAPAPEPKNDFGSRGDSSERSARFGGDRFARKSGGFGVGDRDSRGGGRFGDRGPRPSYGRDRDGDSRGGSSFGGPRGAARPFGKPFRTKGAPSFAPIGGAEAPTAPGGFPIAAPKAAPSGDAPEFGARFAATPAKAKPASAGFSVSRRTEGAPAGGGSFGKRPGGKTSWGKGSYAGKADKGAAAKPFSGFGVKRAKRGIAE